MTIIHNLIANVESNSYTVTPSLDIHQYDNNTHTIKILLINNDNLSINLNPDSNVTLEYVLDDNVSHLEVEYPVEILNPYRGELIFTLSDEIVSTIGRGTAYLNVINDCNCASTVSFTITISKSHNYKPSDSEVMHPITVDEYNKLSEVISNNVTPKSVISSITLNPGDNTIKVARYNEYGQVDGEEDVIITLPESPTPTVSDHYVVTVTDGEVCTCDKEYDEIVSNILSDKIVIFKVLKADMIIQCPMYSYSEDNDIHFMYINLSTVFHIYKDNGTTYVEHN